MPLTLHANAADGAAHAYGEKPTDALRHAVRSLLEADEPATVVDALFDVPVIARRCLGRRCWLVNDVVVDGASFVAEHRARLERVFGASAAAALSSPR